MQEIIKFVFILFGLFFSIDAMVCGYIGFVTKNTNQMPRFLFKLLLSTIERGWVKNHGKNKLLEKFMGFKAICLYNLIGGLYFLIFILYLLLRYLI